MNIQNLIDNTPTNEILARLVLNSHKDNEDFCNGMNEVSAVRENFNNETRTDSTIKAFAPTWADRFLKELCFT